MTTFLGPPPDAEAGIGSLTLGGLLAESAARFGDKEALSFHGADGVVRWSYRELHSQARLVARSLLAWGIPKGARVALLMGNRPEWVAAAFGTAMVGGVLAPINTYFEPPELGYVLRHGDAAVLLCQERLLSHAYLDQLADLCPELETGTPGRLQAPAFPFLRLVACLGLGSPRGGAVPWATFLERGSALDDAFLDQASSEVSPADSALVVYTSGTTARPKGVLHTQAAPALQSRRFAHELCLDAEVRVWSAFPFFWTAGFAMVMGATLAAGGCLVLQEHFEPAEALRLLETERVTSPHAWPHQLAQLEDHPDWRRRDLSALRHVEAFGSFGRHPSVQVDDAWSPRAAYGLTETFTIVSSWPACSPAQEREGHQGRILPGNAVRILDPKTGEPLPVGEHGEIAVRGPTLMEGYAKVPRDQTFDADGFFHTGDAGFVDEEARLHWTGRTSDLIKTGGANVSPVEIEEALLRLPALKAALAVGVPDPQLGEMVVVCAVSHGGAEVSEADVREFLRGRIASYKIPRRVLFFDEEELSLTGNQKIRADDLRALAVKRLG